MSAFILKLVAVFSMTCDHLSYLIFGEFSFLNYIGRIAFPIFAYQITEGYIHTSSLKNYFLRLFVFALLSQIPFMLFYSIFSSSFHLNIFFSLLLGLFAITIYDIFYKLEYKNVFIHIIFQILGIIFSILIAYLAYILKCDYGYFGVLCIFVFYLFRNNKVIMNFSFVILVLIYYGKSLLYNKFSYQYILIIICTISSIFFINLYNHKKGRNIKYFLYLFYPLHLLIIYSIYKFI